jgi:hypothetical protein
MGILPRPAVQLALSSTYLLCGLSPSFVEKSLGIELWPLALWTAGTRSFCVVGLFHTVGGQLRPVLHSIDTSSILSYDDHECLQTLSHVPWGAKIT